MSTYIDKVNIKQGTRSKRRFSSGNTLPLTALPHSMVAFVPQTNGADERWFYNPDDRSFEGIRLTHQPSPWMGDFSFFSFMPQAEQVFVNRDKRWSGIRPEDTILRPDYMKVKLLRYGATVELAPTQTGATIRLHFDTNIKVPRFAINPTEYLGSVEIDKNGKCVYGYTTSNIERSKTIKYYYVFEFDCDISDPNVTDCDNCFNGKNYVGKGAGANVALSKKDVIIHLATSFISLKQARLNLERERKNSFEEAVHIANDERENILSRIEVHGKEEDEKTFYSCMYRAFLYPTKFYEINEGGVPLHIDVESGEVKQGIMYTNNGFWDTYRTVYPLYSLIARNTFKEICKGWLNFYDDTGYLPRWTSMNEVGTMPGTLIEAVFAEATCKNILDADDKKRALEAMLKNAEVQANNKRQGRKCVEEYKTLGYIPYDKCKESVNETLDCAYGDYCISVVAENLGETEVAKKYLERSKNYKNLFDKNVGFMRAKNSNGEFRKSFDEYKWGEDYTEASAWQTSLSVQHDTEGLTALYGGRNGFLNYLDNLFSAEPFYDVGGYGEEIHEMTEMGAVDYGQCAISNQPSMHIPYLYAKVGKKEKSVEIIKSLLKSFSSREDGFPGDDDNGTMAAWFIFTSLGFYPICPGKNEYVVTKPIFDQAILHSDNGDIDLIEQIKSKTEITNEDLMNK